MNLHLKQSIWLKNCVHHLFCEYIIIIIILISFLRTYTLLYLQLCRPYTTKCYMSITCDVFYDIDGIHRRCLLILMINTTMSYNMSCHKICSTRYFFLKYRENVKSYWIMGVCYFCPTRCVSNVRWRTSFYHGLRILFSHILFIIVGYLFIWNMTWHLYLLIMAFCK